MVLFRYVTAQTTGHFAHTLAYKSGEYEHSMTLLLIIKSYYQEAIMNNHKVKGFIEKTRDAFKRATGKLIGEKTSAKCRR